MSSSRPRSSPLVDAVPDPPTIRIEAQHPGTAPLLRFARHVAAPSSGFPPHPVPSSPDPTSLPRDILFELAARTASRKTPADVASHSTILVAPIQYLGFPRTYSCKLKPTTAEICQISQISPLHQFLLRQCKIKNI